MPPGGPSAAPPATASSVASGAPRATAAVPPGPPPAPEAAPAGAPLGAAPVLPALPEIPGLAGQPRASAGAPPSPAATGTSGAWQGSSRHGLPPPIVGAGPQPTVEIDLELTGQHPLARPPVVQSTGPLGEVRAAATDPTDHRVPAGVAAARPGPRPGAVSLGGGGPSAALPPDLAGLQPMADAIRARATQAPVFTAAQPRRRGGWALVAGVGLAAAAVLALVRPWESPGLPERRPTAAVARPVVPPVTPLVRPPEPATRSADPATHRQGGAPASDGAAAPAPAELARQPARATGAASPTRRTGQRRPDQRTGAATAGEVAALEEGAPEEAPEPLFEAAGAEPAALPQAPSPPQPGLAAGAVAGPATSPAAPAGGLEAAPGPALAPAAAPAPAPAAPAPPAAAAPAPTPPASRIAIPAAGRALSPAAVQTAVGRLRVPFDRCVQSALGEAGGQALVGRRIGLLVAVGPGGLVETSEVDEPDVEQSPLGACLRRVASRLLFPPFDGEPVGLRIPLVLGAQGP